jgi:DNA-directed RNA polymerase specialized sigma24 family protein
MSQATPVTTLKALYQDYTSDHTTHQRTIGAIFARLDKRRQGLIRARVEGRPFHAIAEKAGISHPSVIGAIKRAMEQIRKTAAAEPRFNRIGRKKREDVHQVATTSPASKKRGRPPRVSA